MNPATFKVFEAWGKKATVSESISFLKVMLPLSKLGVSGKDINTNTLIGIYDRFIPPNTKEQINLPADIDLRLQQARDDLDKAIKGNDQNAINKAKGQLHLALNLARQNIVHLVKTDLVMKIVRDEEFGTQIQKATFDLVHKFQKKGGIARNRTKFIEVDMESLPVKKMPEPDAPMRPIKADRPLRKAKADNPELAIKREKAPDPNARLKKALAKAPGVKGRFNELNEADFKKIVDELKKEGTVYSKNTELLFINKAKEILTNKA